MKLNVLILWVLSLCIYPLYALSNSQTSITAPKSENLNINKKLTSPTVHNNVRGSLTKVNDKDKENVKNKSEQKVVQIKEEDPTTLNNTTKYILIPCVVWIGWLTAIGLFAFIWMWLKVPKTVDYKKQKKKDMKFFKCFNLFKRYRDFSSFAEIKPNKKYKEDEKETEADSDDLHKENTRLII